MREGSMHLTQPLCSKHETAVFLMSLLFLTGSAAHGQARKSEPQTTVLLVDTDDSCRLSVDDQDEGVITPAQAKKATISPGDHIVKCVVEGIPDLTWRKIVQTKSSEQVVAMVALKALHIQYDQAVSQAHHAAAAQEQAAAAAVELKMKQKELLQTANSLIGTWQRFDKTLSDLASKCPDEGYSLSTYTLKVYAGSGPGVFNVEKFAPMLFHHVNKSCKFTGDQVLMNVRYQGFIKLIPDKPIQIVVICDGCDSEQLAQHRTDNDSIGEISFIDANTISISWKQNMHSVMQLSRAQ
jgi:hypothetical protein